MERIQKELELRYEYYQSMMKKAEEALKKAPKEGRLRVANKRGKPQYYLVSDKHDTKGKYLAQKDRKIAEKLAQRDYNEAVLRTAQVYCKQIKNFLKGLPKENLNTLHLKSSGRVNLIVPYELSDEEYVKKWEAFTYEGKYFDEGMPEIYTNRGERVRSKSEKIIADKLYELGIPYRYECPVYLKGFGKVYPDFTLLNVPQRKEIILEHFGMMDQPDYSAKAVVKIHLYESNGFWQGDNLLLTYETAIQPLNTRMLETMLQKFAK